MKKALRLVLELVDMVMKKDIKGMCRVVDDLKVLSDTYKRSC